MIYECSFIVETENGEFVTKIWRKDSRLANIIARAEEFISRGYTLARFHIKTKVAV